MTAQELSTSVITRIMTTQELSTSVAPKKHSEGSNSLPQYKQRRTVPLPPPLKPYLV